MSVTGALRLAIITTALVVTWVQSMPTSTTTPNHDRHHQPGVRRAFRRRDRQASKGRLYVDTTSTCTGTLRFDEHKLLQGFRHFSHGSCAWNESYRRLPNRIPSFETVFEDVNKNCKGFDADTEVQFDGFCVAHKLPQMVLYWAQCTPGHHNAYRVRFERVQVGYVCKQKPNATRIDSHSSQSPALS